MKDLVGRVAQALEEAHIEVSAGEARSLKHYLQAGMDLFRQDGTRRLTEAAARIVLREIRAAGFVLMPQELAPLGLTVEGIDHPIYMLPPCSSDKQSVIALSLAKAGSTMFFDMLKELCGATDLTYVNFTHSYFVNGVDPARLPPDEGKIYAPRGYCYAGFRSIPTGWTAPAVREMKKMLLVRDIRDTLVSRYFSGAYSHPLPGDTLDERYRDIYLAERSMLIRDGVDAGVLALVPEYRAFWDQYKEELAREAFKIWRYEDVVFDKVKWAHEICDYVGLRLDEEQIAMIARRHDVFPAEEREEFVRKVTPGDHREKLSPAVIAQLDEIFSDYQSYFGYDGGEELPVAAI